MPFRFIFPTARKVGVPDLEIETILESSRLGLDFVKYVDAICDEENMLDICGRTGFRFY